MKLLIVEDNDRVTAALRAALVKQGFDVMCAFNAAGALDLLRGEPDLILLDIGLPDRDGMSVCRDIRSVSGVPIIMTTARGGLAARVAGLDIGADDYLVKPYNLAELLARIRAVARRYQLPGSAGRRDEPGDRPPSDAARIVVGPLCIDVDTWSAEVGGAPLTLTRKEFELLALLARHPGEILRHQQIIEAVWPDPLPNMRRTLHVHMSALRQKLGAPEMIETVHGVGYRLVVPAGGADRWRDHA